jgi:hypothetical protein
MTSISRGKTCKHQASQEVEVGKDGTNKRRKDTTIKERQLSNGFAGL